MPPKNRQLNSGVLYLHDTGVPIGNVNESTLYGLTSDYTIVDELLHDETIRYVDTDIALTKRMLNEVYCNGNFEKGEVIKAMRNINDILVKVGNKFYRPTSVEYEMGLHEPTKLNIEVTLAPYCEATTKELADPFAIKDVIFNDPATIVLWKDGTKTVVKIQNGEEFDPEKGLAMAITKKALGNKGKYFDILKKHLKK